MSRAVAMYAESMRQTGSLFENMKSPRLIPNDMPFSLRRLMRGYAFRMLAGMLVLNVSVAYAADPKNEESGETQALAASVNGVPIKIDDLAPQVDGDLRKYKKYGVQRQDNDLLKALRMQALEKLISVELLYQEARKIKVDDLDERVAAKLSELKEQNGEHEGFDAEKIREVVTKQLMIEEYLAQNKLKDPEAPESEVKEYYEKNKEAFRRKESVRTRHVLVSVAADATPEEKAAARKKIEEARKLILGGKPFEEIAKEYSNCNSASGGGELGYQEKGYMPQEFDDVAFSLEPGKLSEIVETKFGYHIIEVIDHRSAGIQPFEEVKDFIARYLNIQQRRKAMDAHLSALRKKAKVDIYL